MRISSRQWGAYKRAHAEVVKAASERAMDYYDTLPWNDNPDLAMRLMRSFVYDLVEDFGLADGEVSALYYEELMALQGANVPPVELAQPTSAWAAQDVEDALRHATTTETARSAVGDVTERHVRRAGRETTMNAAVRDKAMWAWVCIGDTCPFCRTLGSQGWVRASKAVMAGQHAEHVHANCDCDFVVKPAGSVLEVEGYDPDALLDEYRDAAEGKRNSQDAINQMRRDSYTPEYAAARNARRRELYAQAHHEDESAAE